MKRAELGVAPKKTFNLKEKQRELALKEELDGEKKVIDPLTIKVRRFRQDVGE